MPMVVMNEGVKESSLNRSKQQDLPTPESPISSSLIYVEVSILSLSGGGLGGADQEIIVARPSHLESGRVLCKRTVVQVVYASSRCC